MTAADNFLGLGKTTRKTSTKKKSKKVYKKIAKSQKPKKKVGAKTATAALNTYKSVKTKIFGTKESRANNQLVRKEKRLRAQEDRAAGLSDPEIIQDIPIRRSGISVMDGSDPIQRTTGIGAMERDIQYKINPVTRKIDYDSAIDSDLGNEQDLGEVIMEGSPRRRKKNNTLLYVILALIVAFAIYKMTAKK